MSGPLGRLSVQIALGPVLVIALIGAAMLWRVDIDLHDQAEDRFAERVKRASMQLEDRINNDVQLRIVGASVLATQPAFAAAVEANDTNAIVQIAGQYMARTTLALAGASGIRVYGPAGNLIVRAEAPRNGTQRVPPPEVLTALQGGRPAGSVRVDETLGLSVSGIAPVTGADGRMLAAVEAISSLDRTFVRNAAGLVNTEVAVLSGGRITAASEQGTTLDPARVTDSVRALTADAPAELDWGSGVFLSDFVTFRDGGGRVLGDVYVGIDHDTIDASVDETRGAILRTMVGAMLLATVSAWLFGWVAMRPMQPLLAAARRLQQNDLESPVPATGPTELRQLGEAMEDMRLAIQQSRDALQSANRDLASRVSSSDASLSEVTQDLDVMQAVVSQLAGESAGGLPAVAEELLRLNWVDGAFIALATESGALSAASSAGLPPGAAAAVLDAIESHLVETPERDLEIRDTTVLSASGRLPSWLVGGLAVAPMLTPEGTAGVICVTSIGSMVISPQRRELLRSIAHEVTATLERSELADEVEENRRVAEAVLREMADGVIVVDHENVGQICNPAAARLLGLTRADIIGRPTEDWIPVTGSTLNGLRLRALDGARGGTPLLVETRGLQLAITAGPFPDPDPARSGVILLIRDLSAEAEAERVKRDFVSMVGHELRTPLTLIRTTIDLLHEHDAGALNPTQERIVEVLRQNSDRLMSLISDLLDMSALDSGRMQIIPASTDLVEIVQSSVRGAQHGADDRQHRVRVVAPQNVTVWADAPRIEQVLSNLLSNAIKYTPSGGDIEVRVVESTPFASVSVADSGIGIPPEEQGALFEKFYRTSSGRRTTGGTGLGLAIARSIVELHGGSIRCDSDGKHGTTFTFTLPRRPV
ncbi:MAG: HAMP domain-containing protein [Chloroflexi bacterium]|nr:HAMP domain-containing protein [Chloroflexota bacterium]